MIAAVDSFGDLGVCVAFVVGDGVGGDGGTTFSESDDNEVAGGDRVRKNDEAVDGVDGGLDEGGGGGGRSSLDFG